MRVLYIQPGRGIGGAKVSLSQVIQARREAQASQIAFSAAADPPFLEMIGGSVERIHVLALPSWFASRNQSIKNRLIGAAAQMKVGWFIRPAIRLAKIIRREKIDLIHTNSSVTPVGGLASCLTKRPHVWHVREAIGKKGEFPLAYGDRISAFLFRTLSDAIICNSNYTASFLRMQGLQPHVIYTGINVSEFAGAEERGRQLRYRLALVPDRPVVGMVGSINSPAKEHEVFLRAAARMQRELSNCQPIIFGGSARLDASPCARHLSDTAAKLGLEQRIFCPLFIEDIPAIMHSIDILVHPASREGLGRVVMEAMAAGKPVVGVDAGGVKELVRHGETGLLFSPGDAQAITEAVRTLVSDQALCAGIGQRAAHYAREHFNQERTASAIGAIYSQLV